nr:cytochrome P450 6A1-like [Nomia melanderi]
MLLSTHESEMSCIKCCMILNKLSLLCLLSIEEKMLGSVEIVCGLAILAVLFYYYMTWKYDFWIKHGIPGPKPKLFFGTSKDLILARTTLGHYTKQVYDEFNGTPLIGLFMGRQPTLFLNSLDLIKDVLIKDFNKFSDRGFKYLQVEPLSQNILNLEPAQWRPLRSKLSPVFSSGKLKDMYSFIVDCSTNVIKYLDRVVEKGDIVKVRNITQKYTLDVIGNCGFGIETKVLENEDSEFHKVGKRIFSTDLENIARVRCKLFFPEFYNFLGHIVPEKKITGFFTKLVAETIEYRERNNIRRLDFINVLMEMKKNPEKIENMKLTNQFLTAQAFIFFVAGFKTSSATMANVLYELACHQDIQDKVRNEIMKFYAEHGEEIKYEHISQYKYLDKVFKETLRLYPIAPVLFRRAIEDYTFHDTKFTIPKDMYVWISIYALHRDPEYFPNPHIFDSERFNEEAIAARHSMCYLPFGDGPRNCIGERFSHFQSKLGMIKILRNYKMDVCEKTFIPYEFDLQASLMAPKEDIYLRITKLKK